MPCYDSRNDPSEVRKDCRHNSDVAELLCTVMKYLDRQGDAPYTGAARLCRAHPELAKWWREHQARDAERQRQVAAIGKQRNVRPEPLGQTLSELLKSFSEDTSNAMLRRKGKRKAGPRN